MVGIALLDTSVCNLFRARLSEMMGNCTRATAGGSHKHKFMRSTSEVISEKIQEGGPFTCYLLLEHRSLETVGVTKSLGVRVPFRHIRRNGYKTILENHWNVQHPIAHVILQEDVVFDTFCGVEFSQVRPVSSLEYLVRQFNTTVCSTLTG